MTKRDKQQIISHSIIVITLLLSFGLLCGKTYAATGHMETMQDYVQGLTIKDHNCLIINAYHEARGEGYSGIAAITEVVLNRSRERSMRVCAIIYEPYQFSWTRGSRSKRIDWKQYEVVKNHVTKHIEHLKNGGKQVTKGATYFHTKHVRPSWSRHSDFKCTSKIGKHLFYREFKNREFKTK